MRKLNLCLCIAILGLSAGMPAEARQRQAGPTEQEMIARYYNDPYYGYQGGKVCPRWCPNDRTPCDPPNFKYADGRCDPSNR
ncbi:hypothetical protein [Labrys wisconsinensis]|uniref:Uncharacterized protein n=1 Tax=Labrys wisconsinensis TaxID=425677 RepID=A0ABU0J8G4_9HYPH|nr:hypothetical protein [Labrys wisconsinensis]MDQ0469723.1 hypothetical protein [Labrys wisconsinensis]